MTPEADCIQPRALQALVAGSLPQDEMSRIERHLESCAACQQALAELIDADDAVARVAGHLRATVADLAPSLRSAAEKLGRRGAAGVEPGDREPVVADPDDAAQPVSLDFLEASDRPGSLGRLGRYEISEVVGHGGMGVVLKAHDAKLNRVVAIKILAPELARNATARKRFLREAQAAAAITHQNVVTIHAVYENESPGHCGLPYLVMEFVDGQSLETKLDREGSLSPKEILRIGTQVAAGLAAAHAHGLIHRDIKPANILLENGVERVRITDFGLARAVDDVGLTKTGEVAGTPQYMSPEQAQGQTVDARSDLFSLGCVLYAMCTGRSPFRADTTVAALRRVCDEAPRPIREINADIPDGLMEIIDRLLAKNPADRFATAAEVSDLLARHLAHLQDPAGAPRPETAGPLRSAPRRRRWLLSAAILLAAFGSLGFTEATGVTKLVPTVIRIVTGEGTLEQDAVTIPRGGRQVLDHLRNSASTDQASGERRPESSTAPIATGTAVSARRGEFVILARAGVPEHQFDTLAAVVRGSRAGDTIEIRGNGPFMTDPVTVDHALTLRAGDGFRPVMLLTPEQEPTAPILLKATAALVLEGLEFRRTGPRSRRSPRTVIQSLATLSLANCRLLTTRDDCLWSTRTIIMRNCEFLAIPDWANAISWHVTSAGRSVIENCVITGGIYLRYEGRNSGPRAASVRLRRNTVVGLDGVRFDFRVLPPLRQAEPSGAAVRVETVENVFDSRRTILLFNQSSWPRPVPAPEAETLVRGLFDWRDERNLYRLGSGALTLCVDDELIAPPTQLGDWNRFWGLTETGSIHGEPRFQREYERGEFVPQPRELDPEELSAEDFRLHPDSAGYRAGPDGKDLGAEIEFVGPGAAYDRWKQTPEYQEWRREIQAMIAAEM